VITQKNKEAHAAAHRKMPGIELLATNGTITQDGQEPALSEEELSYLASSLALEATLEPARDPETTPPSQANPALSKEEQVHQSSDDLIPSGDPCHQNLKLRNVSVELLQRTTARTLLAFILSLLDGEDLAHFVNHHLHQTSVSYSPTRHSIITSVLKNRDSFARQARSETQLIIAQSVRFFFFNLHMIYIWIHLDKRNTYIPCS
jgi:hypothetical protein